MTFPVGEVFPVGEFIGGSGPIAVVATDLDGDGSLDLATATSNSHRVWVLLNLTTPPASEDLDRDGIPDECERNRFLRGDANSDGDVNITDALFVLRFLFGSDSAPGCRKSADANDNGKLSLTDAALLLIHVFAAGAAPEDPFPNCGTDPTPDTLTCDSARACE
jgi:hypothetical protein